jgi:hypothetical protein
MLNLSNVALLDTLKNKIDQFPLCRDTKLVTVNAIGEPDLNQFDDFLHSLSTSFIYVTETNKGLHKQDRYLTDTRYNRSSTSSIADTSNSALIDNFMNKSTTDSYYRWNGGNERVNYSQATDLKNSYGMHLHLVINHGFSSSDTRKHFNSHFNSKDIDVRPIESFGGMTYLTKQVSNICKVSERHKTDNFHGSYGFSNVGN